MTTEEVKNTFMTAVVTAGIISVGFGVIEHFRKKKAAARIHEQERAFLQKLSDDLKAGTMPFDDEIIARFEAIIKPLRDQGLIN